MKGILIKDAQVMFRQTKLFLIIILLFAIVPQIFTKSFAIMYATIMPITAIAYDERAKWGQLAAMMPYRKRDLTMSKYIIGIVAGVVVVLLEIISTLVLGGSDGLSTGETLYTIAVLFGTSLILLSLNIPVVFKIGSEKGRLVYFIFTMAFAFSVVAIITKINYFDDFSFTLNQLIIGLYAIAVVSLIISMKISEKVYDWDM